MGRLRTLFWMTLATAMLFATFAVKYAVQNLENSLDHVRKETAAEQARIHDLRAEWSYLTQPERLAELNQRFLFLAPEAPKQLEQAIADIPFRIAPPPPPDMIAQAAPAAAAAAAPAPAASPAAEPVGPHLAVSGLAVTPVALRTAPRTAARAPSRARATHALDQLFAQIAGAR